MLATLARVGQRIIRSRKAQILQATRNGSSEAKGSRWFGPSEWHYRKVPEANKDQKMMSDVFMAVLWYWILYHMYYDFAHIPGHHKVPDPSKWTDAELGIPKS